MPQLETMMMVAAAGLALSATPGPSMLYVLSRTVAQNRAAGLASALGLALGGMILAVATALGLAVVFARAEWLVTALRYAGSAYLVWLGVSMIREARTAARTELAAAAVRARPFWQIVLQGLLVEVLNPKTVLFFALFLPPFVVGADGYADQREVQWQLLTLGILVPLTAIPSDVVVAFAGGSLARVLNRSTRMREVLGWVAGAVLIVIAINLHVDLFGGLAAAFTG